MNSRWIEVRAVVRAFELELIESYGAMRRDFDETPDPFIEASLADGLERSTEADW